MFIGDFVVHFFSVDKASVIDFYNVSMDNFSDFVNDTQTLGWEVNYWSWLETNKKFKSSVV